MTFGLQIRDATGTPKVTISDRIGRVVFAHLAGATESDSAVLTGFDPDDGIFLASQVDDGPLKSPHILSYNAGTNTLSWAPLDTGDTGVNTTMRSASLITAVMFK